MMMMMMTTKMTTLMMYQSKQVNVLSLYTCMRTFIGNTTVARYTTET